jgi:hypothetical protein
MNRKTVFSFALTFSLLLSLTSFAPARAQQPPRKFREDTGVLTPGLGQILRITVNGLGGNDTIRVRLRWMRYASTGCSGMPAVCRHTVDSEGVTPLETVDPDEALSFDLQGMGDGVRVVVESNSPNTRVLGIVFDTSTQRIVAICTFIPD